MDAVRERMMRKIGIDKRASAGQRSSLREPDRPAAAMVEVVVHFSDGGRVTLRLLDSDAMTFGLAEDAARDSHGNHVPVRRDQMAGALWAFDVGGHGNPNDRRNLIEQIRFLGVDVGHLPPDALRFACGADDCVPL